MLEKLNSDMINAMKNKEKEKLTVIRMVKAALKQEEIDHKKEINDDLVTEVVSKQVKERKDSIKEFSKGGRDDLVKKNEEEIEILMAYLPKQLTEEEINNIIDEIFNTVKPTGQKDMGMIMKEASAKLKGKADMSVVSGIIKTKLSNL